MRLLCRIRYDSVRSISESTLDSGRSRSLAGDGEEICNQRNGGVVGIQRNVGLEMHQTSFLKFLEFEALS